MSLRRKDHESSRGNRSSAVAIGNSYKLEIKKGWIINAVLYMVLVGKAGTCKTHPLVFALKPFVKFDSDEYKIYKELKKEYDRIKGMSKTEREEQGVEIPHQPKWKKTVVSDITPEALAEVLNTNERGICLHADELASWFNSFEDLINAS